MKDKVILVVDDDEMNLQVAQMVLERRLPCKVICVDNGVEAIEILKERRVNLVLLDVMMPDFDGIETLQEIRNDPFIKDVPVMMLTATVNMDTVKKAGKLGVKDYIKKPFLPADLIARVEKKLAEEPPRTEVLIIGDEYKVLKSLKEIIESNFKHEVSISADYDDAIQVLNETKTSLIILSGDMRFVDGFKLLAHIASNDKFKGTPLAVTTLDKIMRLVDKLNQIKDEDSLLIKVTPKVEAEPAKKSATESPAKKLHAEPSPVDEKPPVDEKISADEKPPVVKEVIPNVVVTREDKKKLAKVVTNLIGYDLDVRV